MSSLPKTRNAVIVFGFFLTVMLFSACPRQRRVVLRDVPLTGAPVVGSAMTHEHIMAELAFSGKWFWGSIDGPENEVMRSCDGDGGTHAGADLLCSVAGWFESPNGAGFDTCCHSGGFADCNYKATNGYDSDEQWTRLDWPKWDTQAHPRYWVGDMERALINGLKLVFAIAVENESLCAKVDTHVTHNPFRRGFHCDHGDSYYSVVRQIEAIKAFARSHSATFEVAFTPAEARAIIQAGKMAIILGIEADYAWGNEKEPIDYLTRLQDYYNRGVRHIYLTHKLNGPLAGAAYPSEPPLKLFQFLHNCWYLDLNCHLLNSTGDVTNYYELNDPLAIRLLLDPRDGFATYPPSLGGGIITETETNFAGESYSITKNAMGLSITGSAVVDAMMKKGMFVDISHLSERSINAVYAISQRNLNYPLSATHALIRAILPTTAPPIDGRTPMCATAEATLSDRTLERIATTEGFVGHFIAPDPTLTYGPPNIPPNVPNDCVRSDKSLAQSLAYTVDKLEQYRLAADGERVSVALAGDFMGQGLGVAPRLGYSNHSEDWCGGNSEQQQSNLAGTGPKDPRLSTYSNPVAKEEAQFATRGFAHPGLIEQLYADLTLVGLPSQHLDPYRQNGAENVIRAWEKAVYISAMLP
jgi:microsomal dipeptidase-like Zn-dependent dipeptidase